MTNSQLAETVYKFLLKIDNKVLESPYTKNLLELNIDSVKQKIKNVKDKISDEITKIITHLIKDDDIDLMFYVLYSKGIMERWNGREN